MRTVRPIGLAVVVIIASLFEAGMVRKQAWAQPPALSEPSRWLAAYLRIDTTNPPGNEGEAAAYLADILHQEGIATRRIVTSGGRVSLYARLDAGEDGAATLVLMHHMDVVPPGEGWRLPPFSGLVEDGRLWGRGAVDAKSLGIAQLAAFVHLEREGIPLSRNVVYLAVADEETGGSQGTGWLLDSHPELFDNVEAVLNEGGANRAIGENLLWWGVEVSQKRPLWLRVKARGRGGHASTLNPSSATHQLVTGLARLLELPERYRLCRSAYLSFHSIAASHPESFQQVFGAATFEEASRRFETFQAEGRLNQLLPLPGMQGYFLDTLQVTTLANGRNAVNVVPEEASALIDIRLLPDTDSDAFLDIVRGTLGPHLEVEVLLSSDPTQPSPIDTPFFSLLEESLSTRAPVVPAFIPGTTDSRYFRERGIAAYGFSPFVLGPDEARGIHSLNENIPIAKFERGVETTRRLLVRLATAPAGPAESVSGR